MANILSRIWGAIASCFRRKLDDEIIRVMEKHEEHHAIAHSGIPPIVIILDSNREMPELVRRGPFSDFGGLGEEFNRRYLKTGL